MARQIQPSSSHIFSILIEESLDSVTAVIEECSQSSLDSQISFFKKGGVVSNGLGESEIIII